MDYYKDNLTRKLKFKCRQIQSDLDEAELIYNNAVSGFCEHVLSFCKEIGCKNPLDHLPKENEDGGNKVKLPQQFKKVFSSIVTQTHPDKTKDASGVETYQKAVEAKKENKVEELISLAQDLKINISHLSYSDIRGLEDKICKMEEKIDSIHKSYPWIWYYTPLNKREGIIKKFCLSS